MFDTSCAISSFTRSSTEYIIMPVPSSFQDPSGDSPAVEKGYVVSFERMTALIKLLKTADIQKMSAFRINRILKSDLVIIDEIGYSPIEKKRGQYVF